MTFRLCFFLLLFIQLTAKAQVLQGRILELKTRTTIGGAIIRNLSSGIREISDTTGAFKISARAGDLISVQSLGYHTDTLYLDKLAFREVYLIPEANTLREVIVRNANIDTSIKWLDPEFHGQRVKYQRNDDGTYKGGMQISVYHKKDSKKRRAQLYRLKDAETAEEISRVFTALNVSNFVPLRGQELQDFVALFRPSIKTYQSAQFSLIVYLNKSYKEYLALPPERRKLPALPKFDPR